MKNWRVNSFCIQHFILVVTISIVLQTVIQFNFVYVLSKIKFTKFDQLYPSVAETNKGRKNIEY